MADKKITELDAATTLAGTEPLAVVQSTTTKKATLAQVLTYINSYFTGASIIDAASVRTNLGLVIGTNVQAYDAGLLSIAGLTTAADKGIYTTASDTYATYDLTTAGRALLDDASASAQRTTLGLGTIATQAASAVAITGGTVDNVAVSELKQAVTAVASTTIDLALGYVIALSQDTNITTLAFSNVPSTGKAVTITIVRTKDATATPRTIAWPASVKWVGAAAPTLTSTASCVDIIQLVTYDGGTTYYASSGLNWA